CDREMCGCTEAKESDAFPLLDTCHTQAAKTDDAGAQQGRGMQVIEFIRQGIDEIVAGERQFSIATRDGVAGKCGRVAQVLRASLTVGARTVRAAEPGDADARTEAQLVGCAIDYLAYDLMARDQAQLFRR